jgi:hypothetical protein
MDTLNTQNNTYWSRESPNFIHKIPLHDVKAGVWSNQSARRITGPVLWTNNNSEKYVKLIFQTFFQIIDMRRKTLWTFPTGFCNCTQPNIHQILNSVW